MRYGIERITNRMKLKELRKRKKKMKKKKMKNETSINAVKLAIAEQETWNMNL